MGPIKVQVQWAKRGGSAALMLAAYHRDQSTFAGSFSGALNLSAPGMREAVRVAVLHWGAFNIDAMAAPWSPAWLRMNPFVFAQQLKGLPMFISAGSALPGPEHRPAGVAEVFDTAVSMGIEAVTLANTRSFQVRLNSLGIGATFDFPATGIHTRGNGTPAPDSKAHTRVSPACRSNRAVG